MNLTVTAVLSGNTDTFTSFNWLHLCKKEKVPITAYCDPKRSFDNRVELRFVLEVQNILSSPET